MTRSLLCETVTGGSMAELVTARDSAEGADMIELRLDGVADLDVGRALHGRRRPVVVTCRPVWEGGRFEGDEVTRAGLLAEALVHGADYVDIEWRARELQGGRHGFDELLQMAPSRVVVSSHDFERMPTDLCARARSMRETGAAVIKVAVMAHRLCDTLPLIEIAKSGHAVVIGMGDAGVPSRLLASRFGSRWTYGGNNAAPGQMPAARMLREFRFRTIDGDTALYGMVGDDVMRSDAPAALNARFAADGVNAVCVPLRAADADDLMTFTRALGFARVLNETDAYHDV